MTIGLLIAEADVWDDATIADLSPLTISRMDCDELVRVIRDARLRNLTSASDEQLEYYDRKTLELLVYLARRCCRNRMTLSPSRGTVVPGGE